MTARIRLIGRDHTLVRPPRTAGMIARRDPPLRPMEETLVERVRRWLRG